MQANVAVIGGGLAGLTAAIYLARAGKRVTVFERRRYLGGRAVTHLRQGYRFNLGPHAVYRGGASAKVYRELGIPIRGGIPPASGIALHGGGRFMLPTGLLSLTATSLLSVKAKAEALSFFVKIRMLKPARFASMTAKQWLDSNISDARLRAVIEALMRVATYSDAADEQSAAVALQQLKIVLRGVMYVDEGWQKIVDALHSHAVTAGVSFVTSSHVVRVDHNGAVRGVELGELELDDRRDTASISLADATRDGERGARVPAQQVLLAVDPGTAATLLGGAINWPSLKPVTAACLDVALKSLPLHRRTFAVGIDRPIYFSVHSRYAQLTPKGGALVHVAKYRRNQAPINDVEVEDAGLRTETAAEQSELEGVLDEIQPGWRDVLVHRRFLPSMTVSNALVTPGVARPDVRTPIGGLYVAGDWVGTEGILSDAALSSAREAAMAMIADDANR